MPFPLRAVCWLLTSLACAAGLALLRGAVQQLRRERFTVSVVQAQTRIEKRMLPERRSPSRKRPALYAVRRLELRRTDRAGGEVFESMIETPVGIRDVATLNFLNDWSPGTQHDASQLPGGKLELHPAPAIERLFGLTVLVWLLGSVAWFAWGAASDGPVAPAVGWRALMIGVILPVTVGKQFLDEHRVEARELAIRRVRVQGEAHQRTAEEVMEEMRRRGVRIVEPGVVQSFLADHKLGYCEYEWSGKKFRSADIWSLPAPGEPCYGGLNPADPRDVKWDRP